jgi:hypothetical protein
MEEIKKQKQNLERRLYEICVHILSTIHSRIIIASNYGANNIQYIFKEVNMHGCPVLSTKRTEKIRKYVITKLREQGFGVRTIDTSTSWIIMVYWSRGKRNH